MKKTIQFFGILCLMLLNLAAMAQTISGKVSSATEDALPGVNVVIKGTNVGTTTDLDGNYKINAGANAKTLVFSFVGFLSKEVEIGGQSSIDVKLDEDAKQLDEVVVTGLASSIKRSNLANSVSSISAEELIGTTRPATLDGALSGKIIGANITQNSGAPGGGMSIKLRGISSINGTSEPLYIIDGVIVSNAQFQNGAGTNAFSGATGQQTGTQDQTTNRMSDINPADIENIEILKGPSAAAIYGTRANAGVIIITTKRGKAGKTKVSFGQDFGASQAIKLLGAEDWSEAKIKQYGGIYNVGVDEALEMFKAANGKTYDYEKEVYGNTGLISNSRISISGGNEKTKFFLSGSITDETGIQKKTGFGRRSIRANVDHKLTSFMDIKVSSSYMNSNNQRSFSGNDNNGVSMGYSLAYIPNFMNLYPNEKGVFPRANIANNPLQIVEKAENNEKTNRFLQSVSSDIYFFQKEKSFLKLAVTGGIDFLLTENEVYMPDDLQFQQQRANPGASRYTKNKSLNTYIQGFLTYNYKLGRLDLNTQVGAVRLTTDRDLSFINGEGLPAGQRNPNNATVRTFDQKFERWQDVGLVAQQDFNFEDKIVGTVGLRYDKSSLNGDNKKWFMFPRASLAINIAKFDFWKISQINQFKLRAAYGQTGGVPNFGNTFTSMISGIVGGRLGLISPTTSGNGGIEPETARELEFGADLGFFNNKVNVEFTYYDKSVFNLINPYTLAPSTGLTQINAFPVGDLQNTGIELGITVAAVQTANFTWNTSLNYWFNRSKVTRLIIPNTFVGSGFGTWGRNRLVEGESPTAWYGSPNVPTTVDGVTTNQPTKYGDAQPRYQLSWSNNIKFLKNFDFSFLLHTSQGGNNSSLNYTLKDEGGTTHDWSTPSTEVDAAGNILPMGRTARSFQGLSTSPSTTANAIYDASYIRLREVALYYSIPRENLNKLFKNAVDNVRIGFSANNLLTFTNYYGYDPEASNFGNQSVGAGVDLLSFPNTKRYFFHISVDF
ncbi:MAG: SusC/RagA family TonB-linked outer membrane protein [Bacteroidetes bacterium]|nr:MAG: SusC/RagA family TonB-linked outer membrane protein [Bacteroidota bacterium]